ncbi:unknown [Segatella copri CAG:164]|nr:unknown [Segatella copri CAG:164]
MYQTIFHNMRHVIYMENSKSIPNMLFKTYFIFQN